MLWGVRSFGNAAGGMAPHARRPLPAVWVHLTRNATVFGLLQVTMDIKYQNKTPGIVKAIQVGRWAAGTRGQRAQAGCSQHGQV